jgi:hypothetical protein
MYTPEARRKPHCWVATAYAIHRNSLPMQRSQPQGRLLPATKRPAMEKRLRTKLQYSGIIVG